MYKKLKLHRFQRGTCVGGWMKSCNGICTLFESSIKPRNVQFGTDKVGLNMTDFRFVDGRIKFNKDFTPFNALAVVNMNGAHHAGLEGLDYLCATARYNLP